MSRVGAFLTFLTVAAVTVFAAASPAVAAPVVQPVPAASPGSLLKPATSWSTYKNIRYTNVTNSSAAYLDLYVPNNSAPQRPLLVWIHGGGWSGGDKADNATLLPNLVKQGFAVASINYRLTGEAKWPAQIIDVKSAIRALRSMAGKYQIYPDKIGVWGASAGAHLAVMAGSTNGKADWDIGQNLGFSSDVAAVVGDYGPYNLATWTTSTTGMDWLNAQVWSYGLLGTFASSRPDLAANASPVTFASPGDAPTLLWHGSADTTVPPSQSQEEKAALEAAGVPVTLEIVPGMKHAQVNYYTAARFTSVGQFFDGLLHP